SELSYQKPIRIRIRAAVATGEGLVLRAGLPLPASSAAQKMFGATAQRSLPDHLVEIGIVAGRNGDYQQPTFGEKATAIRQCCKNLFPGRTDCFIVEPDVLEG